MSKPSPAPEPTMEEILASIRRIISDGDEMAAPASPAPPPRSAAAPVPMRPATPALSEVEEPDEAEHSSDDADIFDLTDAMVAKPETLPPDFDFDSIDVGEEEDEPADEPVAAKPALRSDPVGTPLVEPDVLEFGADEELGVPEPPARGVQADKPAEAPLPPPQPPEQAARAADRQSLERGTSEPAPRSSAGASAPAQGRSDPQSSLMSPQTDDAVTAAFGRLADTILSRDPKTLEDLVKEMLRPMLKDWLDDNLPVLVEKLVREEIERVSRGRR